MRLLGVATWLTPPETRGGTITLIERELQVGAVHDACRAAVGGTGTMLVVQGEAGLGKTALLGVGADIATGLGCSVLKARGGALERDSPFAVARELFAPVFGPGSGWDQAAATAGMAAAALPALNLATPSTRPAERVASLQGLTWLTRNLAFQTPLLLVIDDAHAMDSDSAAWLHHLTRDISEVRALCLVATRPTDRADLVDLNQSGVRRSVYLEPISRDGVDRLVRSRFETDEDKIAEALWETCRGNPLLISKSFEAIENLHVDPSQLDAAALQKLVVADASQFLISRLTHASPEARRVVAAASVLTIDSTPHLIGALSGLPVDAVLEVAHELVADGVCQSGWPLTFVHPLVEEAARSSLSPAERSRLHDEAAELLEKDNAPLPRVAAHLLATDPHGDQRRVEILRSVAARAMTRTAAVTAVRYLERAVAEPPRGQALAEVFLELGRASALADQPEALGWFSRAAEVGRDADWRARTHRERGWALLASGQVDSAIDAYEEALAEPAIKSAALKTDLLSDLLAMVQLETRLPDEVDRIRHRLTDVDDRDTSVESRKARSASAYVDFARGAAPREVVVAEAKSAIADGRVPDLALIESPAFMLAHDLLTFSDEPATVLDLARAAEASAISAGAPTLLVGARFSVAGAAFFSGDLRSADDVTESVLQAAQDGLVSPIRAFLVVPLRVRVLLARGDSQRARALLSAFGLGDLPKEHLPFSLALLARAEYWLSQGKADQCVDDAMYAGDRLSRFGISNPAVMSWRLVAAKGMARAGRPSDATDLVQEHLELARAYGTPRAIGDGLVARAQLGRPDAAEDDLEEAVEVLRTSSDRLTLASALVTRGAWLRRNGQRRSAREPLLEGREVASACGAESLSAQALDELDACGVRRVDRPVRGSAALTPSERRVCELAATGHGNAEIAGTLFLSPKTIEMHLTNAYRKLAISKRADLREALDPA